MTQSETLVIPRHRLGLDAFLSLFGMGVGALTLTAGPTHWIVWTVAVAITLAGLWFGWRTWKLSQTQVVMGDDALIWNGHKINSACLNTVRLRHFAGARAAKSGEGETQLKVTTSGGAIFTVDSRLEGFEKLLQWLSLAYRQTPYEVDDRSRNVFARFDEPITNTRAIGDEP